MIPQSTVLNDWSDYWFYEIGANVIPANTKYKTINVSWKEYQDKCIPNEIHESRKKSGYYDNGIAIILGKVFRGENKNQYLVGIDIDKKTGLVEFLTNSNNNKHTLLKEIAEKTVVEQHIDEPYKAHIYFYSPIPFPQKTPDSILGIEVKSKGEHGTMFVANSTHENGFTYEILGPAKVPILLNSENAIELMSHIENICRKYDIDYLQSERNNILTEPLKKLINSFHIGPDFQYRVPEGQRHITMLSFANSLLIKHRNKKNKDDLKTFFVEVNEKVCSPPLPKNELINSIWKSAEKWVETLDIYYTQDKTNTDNDTNNTNTNTNNNNTNTRNKKREEQSVNEIYSQKYVGNDYLAEAVLIGNKPYFAVSIKRSLLNNSSEENIIDNNNNHLLFPPIVLHESIPLDETTLLKPTEPISYLNKPYIFESKEEFYQYIENVKNQTDLLILFKQVKSIWKKYVDTDPFHISICAADTIFSYLQDKIGLTHYLFFIGNNGSGKSNNLVIFHYLGYRNMMSTDVTAANIYQYLGNLQEAQGTICEDEADNIDENTDKMRIYKNGYSSGFPVFRTDTTYGRKQYRFFTYCIKAFAAERTPDSIKAKGFNQRVIELHCSPGFPKYDISEVINPAGEEEHQELLNELLETRKNLLIYKLLHFHDKIPDIKLNIENREKQLFKPIVRIFQNSKEVLDELLPVISNYVSQKRENNADTLHAQFYQLIKKMIKDADSAELESSDIWKNVIKELNGEVIKAQTIQTEEFGPISQKQIIQIVKDVLKAKQSKRHDKPRSWIFDLTILDKLTKVYDLNVNVKVEQKKTKEDRTLRTLRTLSAGSIGLDKHISETGVDEND